MQPRLLGKLDSSMLITSKWSNPENISGDMFVVHLSEEQLGGCGEMLIVFTSTKNILEIIKKTETNDWPRHGWYVNQFLSTAFKYRFNETYEVE
jgi:hypothetical protein